MKHGAKYSDEILDTAAKIIGSELQTRVMLDPFAGSGTVGVVALRYGRRFLGLELNPTYCEMARRRIAGPLFAEVTP